MNTLLGQRIREQRKEKGWTIEQFAERGRKLSRLTPGQKKAAIDILNAYTDNIPYITK